MVQSVDGPAATAIDPVAFEPCCKRQAPSSAPAQRRLAISQRPGHSGFPNGPVLNTGTLILTRPGKFTDDQFTENWDREFRSGKDHLSERFFWSDSDTSSPSAPTHFKFRPASCRRPTI